jgi:hypothetical protein
MYLASYIVVLKGLLAEAKMNLEYKTEEAKRYRGDWLKQIERAREWRKVATDQIIRDSRGKKAEISPRMKQDKCESIW